MYLVYLWQKHQSQLLEALKLHSPQHNVHGQDTRQNVEQKLSSEPSSHNSLIQKLKQIVAEKDAKVKELEEEIQQLSRKVNSI